MMVVTTMAMAYVVTVVARALGAVGSVLRRVRQGREEVRVKEERARRRPGRAG